MEARAAARFVRVTPRKARFVIDAVRGKNAHDALAILKFTPNAAARVVEKVLKSAMANAENNHHMNADVLEVSTAFADAGPTMKRIHPRAMGRAYAILKRTSHITLGVSEGEEPARRTQRKQVAQVVSKAKPRRGKAAAEAPTPAVEAKAPKKATKPRAPKKLEAEEPMVAAHDEQVDVETPPAHGDVQPEKAPEGGEE